ncbi:hypothetical protein A2483_04335 [Candidatus Peregrinibacteria bacterium RIFOXYC2_FULL_33_13]|nr:MAG: hypothetical protein UR27_C0001G0010 [Candidatus Peregrinibacteria bacterium GW2011_GWA2_33_10]KKP39741.1 MAG: hypothetical protein UR30_C0008G0010 [Candidatus Peregrinibacteria bacterium GW2011_GWC2_33_13]OGJ50430.1 MAG: hypothetical protein A2229_02405 [Candidatus Peregrinibacteria bacterium RIFOXYA2_FULL_33_7]OGJ55684.1 MAG: hypothetical protein A2483_04335 [Candidatus Peregrinibacteria bacterium RIFOXYC2_FULL_33_13]
MAILSRKTGKPAYEIINFKWFLISGFVVLFFALFTVKTYQEKYHSVADINEITNFCEQRFSSQETKINDCIESIRVWMKK